MYVRIVRTFSYWCFVVCLFLFIGDLSTQLFSPRQEARETTETSLTSRACRFARSIEQSGHFVVHCISASVQGASESAVQLLPCLIETSYDVAQLGCTAIAHPIQTFETCREHIVTFAQKTYDFLLTLDLATLQRYYHTAQIHYIHYCQLPAVERGEYMGHLVGYHVMDFYGGSLAIKTLFHLQHYKCIKQLTDRKGVASLFQMKPTERVKGFAIAVNQATRRERYLYQLKYSLSEPHTPNTRSYGPTDYDGMRLLLECSPLRVNCLNGWEKSHVTTVGYMKQG